jgi:glutamine amidotransferase
VIATLVDYGAGNLRSLSAAFERAGATVRRSDDPAEVASARLVVIPGVGAAGPAMAELDRRRLRPAILAALGDGAHLFGVCLGLQLLFERSEEGDVGCLGLLPGRVGRLSGARRLPHMGWNDVEPVRSHPLCAGLPSPCYFAHTYAVREAPDDAVLATTATEGGPFASLVCRERVAGVQFHPERSSAAGAGLCRAVLDWAADAA